MSKRVTATTITEDDVREEQHLAWQAFREACVALGYVPLPSSACVPISDGERRAALGRVAAARNIRLANTLPAPAKPKGHAAEENAADGPFGGREIPDQVTDDLSAERPSEPPAELPA